MEEIDFKYILDHIYSGVYIVDLERRISYWNKAAEMITGYSAENMTNQLCYNNFLNHVSEEGKVLCHDGCPLAGTILDGKDREANVFLRHKNGYRVPVKVHASPLHDKDGRIIGAIETFSDNTTLVSTRQNLANLSDELMKDNLTGVSNRKYLVRKIEEGINNFVSLKINCGLLFLDIDHFKLINDSFGHVIGDKILKMVANTISKNIRDNDVIGRWGGEEFIVLLENSKPRYLASIAEKIRMLVEASGLRTSDAIISVTISIGATLLHPDDTVEEVIKRADKLMYQSKDIGRNRVTSDVDQLSKKEAIKHPLTG